MAQASPPRPPAYNNPGRSREFHEPGRADFPNANLMAGDIPGIPKRRRGFIGRTGRPFGSRAQPPTPIKSLVAESRGESRTMTRAGLTKSWPSASPIFTPTVTDGKVTLEPDDDGAS